MEGRTRFFDRETLAAIRSGTGQIVIVAAGYDGRALRFASPNVRWFEVDHPSTQADKRARLAADGIPTSAITFVAADLTRDDFVSEMRRAGHDPGRPSLFIVEGLLGYLSREHTSVLLAELRRLAAPGSRLAVAFPILARNQTLSEKISLRLRGLIVSLVGEPWLVRFGADEPDTILSDCGWEIGPSERGPGGRARFEGRQGVLAGAVPAEASSRHGDELSPGPSSR
jgi:methyltransferase (TIGR00027 family)